MTLAIGITATLIGTGLGFVAGVFTLTVLIYGRREAYRLFTRGPQRRP